MSDQAILTSSVEEALWADACLAADVFTLLIRDGLFQNASILVKAHAGPVRDVWLDRLKSALPSSIAFRHIPSNVSTERLLGGLDLSATLSAGRAIEMTGLLADADEHIAFLPMAGLAEQSTISLIAAAMDSGDVRVERDGVSGVKPARFAFVCFDDTDGAEDGVSRILTDRIMLHVDIRAVSVRAAQIEHERSDALVGAAKLSDAHRSQLCGLAAAFGLMSMRPAMQLSTLARCLARLRGAEEVEDGDVAAAVRLGLVHRAQQVPTPPPEEPEQDQAQQQPEAQQDPDTGPPPEPDQGRDDAPQQPKEDTKLPDDMVQEAIQAALPHGLLAYLKAAQAAKAVSASGGRRGAKSLGATRGRPLTSRKGELRTGKRLDLVATLRAAAPWQAARRANAAGKARVHLRRDDLHVRRYQERSETSTIFVVDASGSTAINRLSEAKGAIELLLAESYARRDNVALVSFRGREAQVLLPPTRALVRAKRSLSALPGGGATPLASGLNTAFDLALEERKRGREPSVVLLTDGSANISAAGEGGRKQAGDDARKAAKLFGQEGISGILVDISRRPQSRAQELAGLMGATYVPMPFANAKTLSDAVKASR